MKSPVFLARFFLGAEPQLNRVLCVALVAYFCTMLKGLLKIFLGDKSSSDLKEIQPIVDEILIAEKKLLSVSADELRAKTSLLRSRITDFVSELQNEIDA